MFYLILTKTDITKRKVGTVLAISLFKNLKIQAAEENRPMADIIANAIELCLAQHSTTNSHPISQASPNVSAALPAPSLAEVS